VLGWLVVSLGGGFLRYFNPLYVAAPVWDASSHLDAGMVGGRLLGAMICWGSLGGLCLGLAVWQLRPAFRRELENEAPHRSWYSVERVPIGDDPIAWRERHVEGLSPVRSLRTLPQWLAIGLITLLTTISSVVILLLSLAPETTFAEMGRALGRLDLVRLASLAPDAEVGFLIQSLLALLIASLVVGIRCSGAVTGERERQTWEALLLTPISAKQLVHGKLWGVLKSSVWYLLAYAAPAVLFAAVGGLKALLWTILWLAVTLLAMYYVGAAGIWCSVRCKTSWRSLLGTLGLGYVGGLALYLVCSPAIFVLAFFLLMAATILDALLKTQLTGLALFGLSTYWNFVFVATCLGLAIIFWIASRVFLSWSQRWIADRERTRHWHDEPVFRRPRRPVTK
jgi:ABC-type transport system involved in multi-copper enzyme maturation permease subunit